MQANGSKMIIPGRENSWAKTQSVLDVQEKLASMSKGGEQKAGEVQVWATTSMPVKQCAGRTNSLRYWQHVSIKWAKGFESNKTDSNSNVAAPEGIMVLRN